MAKKYALCWGLNYPGTSMSLSGCINDMEAWAAFLKDDRGFDTVNTYREPIL